MVLRIMGTFVHGLVFAGVALVVAGFSWYSLLSTDGTIARYARAPSAAELAAGKVWLDQPIEAIVPLHDASGDPYDGCAIHEQRYEHHGKSESFVEQRAYAYASARVREPASGRTFDVPLYDVAIDYATSRTLSYEEAQYKLGTSFTPNTVGSVSSPVVGTLRYLQTCVQRGAYLFVDGAYVNGRFGGDAELASGPTMASRRSRQLALSGAGTVLSAAAPGYAMLVVLLWSSPFGLAAFVRRRPSVADAARARWWLWAAVAGGVLLLAVAAAVLGAPPASTILGAVGFDVFFVLAVHFLQRRRALRIASRRPLVEGVVARGEPLFSPVSGRPAAAFHVDVWRGVGKGERFITTLRAPAALTVEREGGATTLAFSEAALDAPATEMRFRGYSAPGGMQGVVGVAPDSHYRTREAVLVHGERVCLLGDENHAAPAAPSGASAYRAGPAASGVTVPRERPELLFSGWAADVRARFERDARWVGLMAACCAVAALLVIAGPIYAWVLAAIG